MEHLTEIKPNAYVLNLPKLEEAELAKRKKKRAPVKQAKKSTEATQKSPAPAVDDEQVDQTIEPQQVSTAPAVDDKTVIIKQAKVSYDEDTRLYTIEFKGEFYDDSRDLDRIARIVRELVPDVSEQELNALKDL